MMLLAALLSAGSGYGQLTQIHPEKLPQVERVKTAYSRVLPVESMARSWSPKWTYETPKERVVTILTSSLKDLQSAEVSASDNAELFLLAGLVAHLAYNVDVEDG